MAKVYIDLMRGTPVLVLLMLMYYVVMAPLDATGIVVAVVRMTSQTDLLAALENGKVDAAGGESLTLLII